MSVWSMMAFVLTTYYLSVQFVVFYEVSTTPVVDTGLDYINTNKKIVIISQSSLHDLHQKMGIIDKTILVSPKEQTEVYLPR